MSLRHQHGRLWALGEAGCVIQGRGNLPPTILVQVSGPPPQCLCPKLQDQENCPKKMPSILRNSWGIRTVNWTGDCNYGDQESPPHKPRGIVYLPTIPVLMLHEARYYTNISEAYPPPITPEYQKELT